MSFSRAPLKRFNDHVGCAPPPGSYDIKPGDLRGAASFDKSDRFRQVKPAAHLPPPSPSRNILVSPVRRTLSVDGLVEVLSAKKERNGMTVEKKQQKLLEKEIRSLVQQRGEQDRRLLALEDEVKKLEAKLLAVVREKTGLAANVTTLERQRAELKKVNEFLKSKASADTTKKRINSLTMELMEARNTLDVKNKELSVLQINSEGQLKLLETNLQASKASVTSLNERNTDLENLYQMMQTQNDELENENARLHAVIQELKQEIRVVQEYLDKANDEIQELRLKLQYKTQENTLAGSQLEKVKQLETDLEQCMTDTEATQDLLRQKEEEALKFVQELQVAKNALWQAEKKLENQELELKSLQKAVSDTEEQMKLVNQEVVDSKATVRQQEAELARLREVLRRTEKELDERVAHLEQRCLFSEEERSRTQEEGLRRVQELRTELNLLKEAKRDEEKQQILLQQEHAVLAEELMKEKALVDSLSVLVTQEREDSEEQVRLLKEELEEVLGELAVLEDQDKKSQEALRRLQEQNDDLERQLSDAGALLESTEEALKRSEEKQKELEEEVETVTQQMKDEMNRVVQQKDEEIKRVKEGFEEHQERQLAKAKAGEENARILLEMQTCLAQKDEEMKAMEENHSALITQLQQELQLQTREKEEALGQLEEHKGQNVTQLQTEMEKAQKLLKEVSQEKEELMHQLQYEREEKVKIQTALKEERGTLEAERSEVLRLQTDLARVNELKESLLSEVEQKGVRLQTQIDLMEEKMLTLQREVEEQQQGRQALQGQLEVLIQEKVNLQWEMEEQQQERQRRISEATEKRSQTSEAEHWRQEYDQLFAKVKPFQEQLNAFAAERNALLNENGANQEELNKLADAYARLLGHQNQKQKIKHVMKLKDENISLKQEVAKLRTQVNRQRSDLEQLKAKLPGAPRRRFDPSKAFQHDKENRQAEATEPRKEGHHYA
ncbi:hyaluronan mediated motility receptor [Mastacembelus armatus]|uniref:Hyaluronan-mediated motility receptor (RHAMM) n=1 Tax=Mastacembelus armatus TaxID=205130 RepID=A0A3Q3M993_9TELE|nr:hyaluronan mediated motility receptor-like [Mastacembelus armatus]